MLRKYIQLLDKLLPAFTIIPFLYLVILQFRNELETKLPRDE